MEPCARFRSRPNAEGRTREEAAVRWRREVNPALVIAAPAKLNLFLHVGAKRDDGFHDLQSLVAFSVFGDEISAEPDESISLCSTGPFGAYVPAGDGNLALKAAKLLAEKTGTSKG